MIRYEDATSRVYKVLKFVVEGWFPELRGAKILPIFDLKQSGSKGKITLASIRLASDLQKYLTIEGTKNAMGYDYILILDKIAWKRAAKSIRDTVTENRIRIVRHELRHTVVRMSKTSPWGLRTHNIEDFHSEIKLNKHNPRWAEELANITKTVYAAKKKETNLKKRAGYED